MKYIAKLKRCLSTKNNFLKVGFCAILALLAFFVGTRLFIFVLNMLNIKEGFTGASELLLLHMKGCPHCVKLIPEWQKFVSGNNTSIKTRSVERTEDPALVKKYNVTGFPTIILLDSQGNKIKDYTGPRTAAGLLTFCQKNSN